MSRVKSSWAVQIAILAVLIGLSPAAGAAEVSVEAVVEPSVVPVGSEATLVVTVKGKFRKTSEPELPPLDDFTVYQAGTSQSFSIVNGKASSVLQFTYVLIARKVGNFTIAPIRFVTGDKEYTADPVVLGVVKSTSHLPSPSPKDEDDEETPEDAGGQPIFIRGTVDRDTVYVNQQVTWTLGFYTDGRVDLLRSPEYSAPTAEGFWAEELPPQRNYYKMIEGRKYLVNEIKRAFFPTAPGEYTIGSATVEIVVDDFASRSVDDFFKRRRGLFGFGKSNTLKSDEITVIVLPLPKSGRPADFSGLVGRNLELTLRTDKQVVEAGDPVNVTLEITGEGNFKTMAAPSLPELDGFKMYESGSKSDLFKKDYVVTGKKKTDFVLIPRNEGKTVIPPIRMSYFDPFERRYKTLESEAIHMEIKPGVQQEGGRQVIFAGSGENIEVLGEDINYIHPVPANIMTTGRRFYQNGLYMAIHGIPLIALLLCVAVERRRRRWREDVATARASRAARAAEKKIKEAAALQKKGQLEESFAAISSALRDYLADKMNQSSSGLTLREIDEYLAGRNVGDEVRERLRSVMQTCDMVQYSSSSTGGEQAKQALEAAMGTVRALEKRYLK